METVDLAILGSGSTAFAAATRAAKLGKSVVMTERRTVGGTCVSRGCLPSKNLIAAAELVHNARHPRYPGLGSCELGVDFPALIQQKDEVVEDYRSRKYLSLTQHQALVSIREGDARLLDGHTIDVGGHQVSGDHVLIATGSRPAVPRIEGLDRVPYLTSDLLTVNEEGELKALPPSLVIVGAGYIALELGQMFHRLGSKVTILGRNPRLLPREEPEIGRELASLLLEEGVDLRLGTSVERVSPAGDGVLVKGGGISGAVSVEAARLLVATGRRPNTDGIGLEEAGVKLDGEGAVIVDDFFQTSVPGVHAAGDVIGDHLESQAATPVGAHNGALIAQNLFGEEEPRKADHAVIPRTIFTDPQVATVGFTDEQANRRGYVCSCSVVKMEHVPRAGAVRDPRGVIKMVIEAESHKVLGVHVLGLNAGEMIHEAAMGLRLGATNDDFIDMIHVYPTMAEALKLVALSFYKDISDLSCCAE